MQDIFTIQDEIAVRVVNRLSSELTGAALKHTRRAYTPSVEAYDLYIQGRVKRIPPTGPNLDAALKLFEQAIEADPKFAGGCAGASFAKVLVYAESSAEPERVRAYLDEALRLAQKAVELDPTFGPAWGSLAEARFRSGAFDAALEAIDKAIAAAPSDSLMRARLGRILGHVGRADEGVDQVRRAMRMSPDSLPLLYFLGANLRVLGKYYEAIEALLEHRKRLAGQILPAPTMQLVAAYSQSGRPVAARAEAQKVLARAPGYTVGQAQRTAVYKNAGDRDALVTAIRAAGIPD
jgi:adenylate cyclase